MKTFFGIIMWFNLIAIVMGMGIITIGNPAFLTYLMIPVNMLCAFCLYQLRKDL